MRNVLLGCFFFITLPLFSQFLPEDIRYTSVYDFLDEMANDGVISINSTIKPYSRQFIAQKLQEIVQNSAQLSKRQRQEVEFYLNDYSLERDTLPDNWNIGGNSQTAVSLWTPGVFYRNNDVKMRITPIIGGEVIHNTNGTITIQTIGAEFQGQFDKHFTLYASLRDYHQKGELLTQGEKFVSQQSPYTNNPDTLMRIPGYITDLQGGAYKLANGYAGGDHSEMHAGIYYSWSWGRVGLANDNIQWGDNYHGSNILSGDTPSFPLISLNLKPAPWVELNFFHGWLTSDVIDSSNYYTMNTGVKAYLYKNKYIAANMITITPVNKLNISFGNSIVYSGNNIQPAFLLPLAFYQAIDHTFTMQQVEGGNSQMYLDVSSRNIDHLHLYMSTYCDEFSVSRLSSTNPQQNMLSWKFGGCLSNYPIKDVSFIAEYTRTSVLCYKHFIPAIDFTDGGYCLGSYLGDNAKEIYLSMIYKPIRGLMLQGSIVSAAKGNELDYIHAIVNQILSVPFMKDKVWSNNTISFSSNYEVVNNVFLALEVDYSNIQGYTPTDAKMPGEYRTNAQGYLNLYTPQFLQGKKLTGTVSLKVGL
jgi:hypothetical protein